MNSSSASENQQVAAAVSTQTSSVPRTRFLNGENLQPPVVSKSVPFEPFSLQHWALHSAVKRSIFVNTRYAGCLMGDNALFDDLKILHSRGARFLDYEFAVNGQDNCRLRVPLHELVFNWDRRYRGTIKEIFWPNLYCHRVCQMINSFMPYCVCRRPPGEPISVPGGECAGFMDDPTLKAINGHTLDCTRDEFRYSRVYNK